MRGHALCRIRRTVLTIITGLSGDFVDHNLTIPTPTHPEEARYKSQCWFPETLRLIAVDCQNLTRRRLNLEVSHSTNHVAVAETSEN